MPPTLRTTARLFLVTVLSLVIAAGTAVVTAAPTTAATWAPSSANQFDPATDLDQFESRILIRVNRVREKHGLAKVRVFESCVDGHAERWATKLKRSGRMVHRDLGVVLDRCNLSWVGENLVSGTAMRPYQAVRAWLNSPPHRSVLLKRRARWAGVGVRVTGSGRAYAVLNFGDRG